MDEYQLTALKNSLRLITIPMPQLESLTVMVGIGAGSRYEARRVNGLFHFLEHMAFKGTQKRPTALKIASEVDGVGGEFNAFTDKEMTGYYLKLASRHQELAFDVLSDIIFNSLFKSEEIEKERGVIIEEINLYEDTPYRKVLDVFERLLYGDNPMGWEIGGDKISVSRIQRQDFVAYVDRLYQPCNMVVSVAGKFNQKTVIDLAVNYFGSKKNGKNISAKPIKLFQKRSKAKLIDKKTEQAHFCLGVPAYSFFHPDRFALGVLTTILGGSMSSRLFSEIREKRGLAYYVSCSPDFNTDCGSLSVRAGVKLNKVEEAIKISLLEFQKISQKSVAKEELKKAKEFLKGRLILALEDSQLVASRYIGQVLLEKKIRTLPETLKLIDRVTPADLLRVAKDVFKPEKLNLALIGPYQNENRFEKVLKSFYV